MSAEERRRKLSLSWVKADNEALARLSETFDGRAFLCRLLVECGVFEPNKSADAFDEGRRSVGLWLLESLEAAEPGRAATILARMGRAGRFLAGLIFRQNDKKIAMEAIRDGRDDEQDG